MNGRKRSRRGRSRRTTRPGRSEIPTSKTSFAISTATRVSFCTGWAPSFPLRGSDSGTSMPDESQEESIPSMKAHKARWWQAWCRSLAVYPRCSAYVMERECPGSGVQAAADRHRVAVQQLRIRASEGWQTATDRARGGSTPCGQSVLAREGDGELGWPGRAVSRGHGAPRPHGTRLFWPDCGQRG